MFDNLKNLMSIMGQAKEIKARMEQMQNELARKSVVGDAGAGAVRITINGKFEVLDLHLDQALLRTIIGPGSDEDLSLIEELIAAACNDGLVKVQALIKDEMSKAAGGLNLPGMNDLLSQLK